MGFLRGAAGKVTFLTGAPAGRGAIGPKVNDRANRRGQGRAQGLGGAGEAGSQRENGGQQVTNWKHSAVKLRGRPRVPRKYADEQPISLDGRGARGALSWRQAMLDAPYPYGLHRRRAVFPLFSKLNDDTLSPGLLPTTARAPHRTLTGPGNTTLAGGSRARRRYAHRGRSAPNDVSATNRLLPRAGALLR